MVYVIIQEQINLSDRMKLVNRLNYKLLLFTNGKGLIC